jgi:hypothetical protein
LCLETVGEDGERGKRERGREQGRKEGQRAEGRREAGVVGNGQERKECCFGKEGEGEGQGERERREVEESGRVEERGSVPHMQMRVHKTYTYTHSG